jgi:hypothetical protein
VAGVPLSLDDIQFTILKQNYDGNPLVLYGLYQGIIGGPNIRPSAYYGDDVYRALEENAIEFVNSNRGTFSIDEGSFRVSSFYKRNKAYFPEFDADLSEHLLQYLEGEEINKILAADNLKANINDWTVTDLGGTRHEVGGSFAYNNAALLDSFKSDRQSSTGGILTATLEVKRAKKPRNPLDEPDVTKPYSEAPVEGASVEEIAAE